MKSYQDPSDIILWKIEQSEKYELKMRGKLGLFWSRHPAGGARLGRWSCPMEWISIRELVKRSWCRWYWKYAPGDTVLEGLEKEAPEAKKGPSFVIRPLILPANWLL